MATGFSVLNSTNETNALGGRLAQSNSLASGEELVTVKAGHSENFDSTRLFFVTSLYVFNVQLFDINRRFFRLID